MSDDKAIKRLLREALDEDLGEAGDITSKATIPAGLKTTAIMRARKPGVAAGVKVAAMVFKMVDLKLKISVHIKDGDKVAEGTKILTITGPARSILAAERVTLNLISHLSGIATQTAAYVKAVQGTKAKILDTRKTLPGLRALQKEAVKAGGGVNHRMGLYDMILIKDNHISISKSVKRALDDANKVRNRGVKIEIEVDNLQQLQEVLNHGGADIALLDNMNVKTLKKAVEMVNGRIITEASGGVTLKTVRAIAKTGVDYISVGALTHSVLALDIGLDINL